MLSDFCRQTVAVWTSREHGIFRTLSRNGAAGQYSVDFMSLDLPSLDQAWAHLWDAVLALCSPSRLLIDFEEEYEFSLDKYEGFLKQQ